MVHACACCPLRFTTNGELADHVREAHAEHPPFEEGRVTVTRRRFPSSGPFQQVRPRAKS
jgi:hypothetical protein